MKTKHTVKALTLAGMLLLGSTAASAVPVVYTSEVSWLAALTGTTITTEDFESSPLGLLSVGTTDVGLFDITIDNNAEGQVGVFNGGAVNGSREFQGDIDVDANLVLDFSNFDVSPIIGFAGDWFSTVTGDRLTMTLNGTTIQFDNYLGGSGNGFLGLIDTDGFTNISFGTENPSSFGEFFALDNVQVAAATEVPEPATLGLLAAGLLGFGLSKRKKSRVS